MAQETTTTFKVTLTYSGPQKTFDKLMKTRGSRAMLKNAETLKSTTKKLKPQSYYTNDHKLVRAFTKQACEAAGLKCVANSNNVKAGNYNLNYGAVYHQSLRVALYGVRVFINLSDPRGRKDLYKIRIPEERLDNSNYLEISVADPNALDILTELFKEFGHKYTEEPQGK